MANHFSSLGLKVKSKDDFIGYFKLTLRDGEIIESNNGEYYKYSIDDNVQLFGQRNKKGVNMGMNPHFFGESRQIVRIEKRNRVDKKNRGSILDGGFICWSGVEKKKTSVEFPFAFDCPDVNRYEDIKYPQDIEVQLAAIAHKIYVFKDDMEFDKFNDKELNLACESFIPSGLLNEDKKLAKENKAMAIMNGHVRKIKNIKNKKTGIAFTYMVVEVLGGMFDVVVDDTLLKEEPVVGGIVGGEFWLTGVITGSYEKRNVNLLQKLFKKQ